MSLNLSILPLRTVENLVTQKCLLSKESFPSSIRPGQWVKCCFHSSGKELEENFAICQIFPREEQETDVCFMDTSVCKFEPHNDDQLVLDSLILLADHEEEIPLLEVSYVLDCEHFIEKQEALSQDHLNEMARILLQQYHFTANCLVKNLEFQHEGVTAIGIHVADANENSNLVLTYDTIIRTRMVSLTSYVEKKDYTSFNIPPFERARHQLNDLLDTIRMQRSYKKSLRISLNALLVGSVGCGKTSLLEDFFTEHKCNVFRLKPTNVIRQYPGESEAELRKVFNAARRFEKQFALEEPIVLFIEDVHLLCPQIKGVSNNSETQANAMRLLTQFLSLIDELYNSKSHILCLATSSNADMFNEMARRPGRFEKEIHIAALTCSNRLDILVELFKQSPLNKFITPKLLQTLATQSQGYAVADLTLLVRNIVRTTITKGQSDLEVIALDNVRKFSPISIKGTDVTAYRTSENFDVIGGMFELKKVLEVSVLAGLKREDAFRRFGLTLPKGVLLYGPPGCAKTTIAKCLATEANMTFIATSGAEVYSPYVGCAEKFVAKLFDTARKNAPCLIFLDEIDSLVGRRSVGTSTADVQIRILSTLLTEMDGIISASINGDDVNSTAHIIVVGATNRPDMIDDALMRPGRFDKLIHVPAPDLLSRRSILELYNRRMPFDKTLNLDEIAKETVNYSGADICNLCNEAAMYAFQQDFNTEVIRYEDFSYVLKTSKSSLTQNQIDWYYDFEKKFLR